MRKRTLVLAAVVSSALALPALALPPPPNTALTHGFDEDSNVLVFGTSGVDDEGNGCDLEAGSYDYEINEDGNPALVEPEAATDETTDDESDGQEDPCALHVVDVTGPNGQINHGQVVSSFVHALRDLGIRERGCIVRTIAQSEYGKGDQQIRTPDVAEADTDTLQGGTVDLESVLTACNARSDDEESSNANEDGNGNRNGHGRPENPGNSANHGNGNGNGHSNNGRGNGKP